MTCLSVGPLAKTYSHAVDALVGEGLRIRLGWVSCNPTDLELLSCFWIAQDGLDNRASLFASGTEDNKDFLG